MDNRYLSLPLAVALGLGSPCAMALGLGQLQVKSGLNQPLVAEIPIISATPSELEQLDVRLASPDAFARVGLDQPGELTANLQFSVGKNARGQPVILVTTPGRFSEPLLSFLIEAEWGKGRVTREYTALIDPPYIAAAVIQPMLAPPVAVAPPPMPVPQPIAPPIASQPPPMPAETAPVAEPEPAPVVFEPQPQPQPIAQVAPPPPPVEPAPPPPRPVPVAPAPKPQAQAIAAPPPRREPAPAAPPPAPTPAAAPDKVGPVAPGQTLWSIANQVRPDPAVSINQMMVALLRANPDAFAQDNINLLKRGSVLRVPGQEEVGRLSEDEAAALVSQQAASWRTPRQAVPQPAESANEMAAAEPVAAKPAAARPAAPKPAPATPASPKPAAPVASAKPSRPASRLEIVPPSGNAAARGAQSGAAAGAGGSELRAELAQAREDLAARTSEVSELKSRVSELEQQDSDRQKLIAMQNSQLKDLQDRLAQMENAPAAAPATDVAAAPAAAPPGAPAAKETAPVRTPWYLNPFLLGGALLLLVGGLVLGLRRNKAPTESDPSAPRLSNDEALRASMAKTRQAGEKITPAAAPVPAVPPVVPVASAAGVVAAPAASATTATPGSERELQVFRDAVKARPQDIEAHLNLLRLLHMRGNYEDFEAAAQDMRAHVPSTLDPRWREVVIMGASLMPANAQFGEAGWNTPRFQDSAAPARSAEPVEAMPSSSTPSFLKSAPTNPEPEPVKVFDPPPTEPGHLDDLDFEQFDSALAGGSSAMDVHRSEAQVLAEDEASATRIELAKAYLDIGDLDGARSMLEEVVSEGGPAAQAEAGRILKEIG